MLFRDVHKAKYEEFFYAQGKVHAEGSKDGLIVIDSICKKKKSMQDKCKKHTTGMTDKRKLHVLLRSTK